MISVLDIKNNNDILFLQRILTNMQLHSVYVCVVFWLMSRAKACMDD